MIDIRNWKLTVALSLTAILGLSVGVKFSSDEVKVFAKISSNGSTSLSKTTEMTIWSENSSAKVGQVETVTEGCNKTGDAIFLKNCVKNNYGTATTGGITIEKPIGNGSVTFKTTLEKEIDKSKNPTEVTNKVIQNFSYYSGIETKSREVEIPPVLRKFPLQQGIGNSFQNVSSQNKETLNKSSDKINKQSIDSSSLIQNSLTLKPTIGNSR